MKKIINKRKYDTSTSTLITSDRYWDGSNWDRQGRNRYLYRTSEGQFFLFRETAWEKEQDSIEPLTVKESLEYYEILPEYELGFKEAFPNVELKKDKLYSISGFDKVEKTASSVSNSAHVYVPVDWTGKQVAVILLDSKRSKK